MNAAMHYDDETLIALLESADAAAITRDEHLSTCGLCRESLDQYRAVIEVMGEEAAWELRQLSDEPDPATIAVLRAAAIDVEREERDAERIVPMLLAGERETWRPRLKAHPEWRTAGVVRKLVAEAYPVLNRMPPDAVEMMVLATEIADGLDPRRYPADTVHRVRADAWRERGYALFYVGKFAEALNACDVASDALTRCLNAVHDQARVDVVRALTLRPFERIEEATALASRAIETFAACGDFERVVTATITLAQMHVKAGDYTTALRHLQRSETTYGAALSLSARALLEGNIAHCYRQLGNVEASVRHYQFAAAMFDEIGSSTEAARVRWNIANCLASSGRLQDALDQLWSLRSQFDAFAMSSESSLVSLDIAELLLADGGYEAAAALCREVVERLQVSGLATTARAMTALAYLNEALQSRAATTKLVRHVRDYVKRLPKEPDLLFAPPPLL